MYESPLFSKLESLAACLCAQIAMDGLPGVCFCGLMPGEVPAIDYIDGCSEGVCGMAWVRLAQAAPTTGIGVVSENVNNCGSEIGFDVELGIVRCMPPGNADGTAPDSSTLLAVTNLQVADMLTMRKAILCCESDLGDHILDTYTPFGPQGMAVGGVWTLTLSES